jgi:hypothetical protein
MHLGEGERGGDASESIDYLHRYLEYLFNQLSCKEK